MMLQFLANVDVLQQRKLEARLAKFVFEPATLTLDCMGYWSRPGIIWLGPRKMPRALSVAVQRLSNQLCALGYRADGRGFKAHVTLVRAVCAAKHFVFGPVTWHAETIVLAASERLPQGPRYSVIM